MVELASFRTPVGNTQPGSSRLDSNESTYWAHVRELVSALYGDESLPDDLMSVSGHLSGGVPTHWVSAQSLTESVHNDGDLSYDRLASNLDDGKSALRGLTGVYPAVQSNHLSDYGLVTVNIASSSVLSGAISTFQPSEAILKPTQMPSSMNPLQEWEGRVVEIDEHEFLARLTDLTASPDPSVPDFAQEEDAIIPNSEIADDDLERLSPGNVFRWVIGYERSPSGAKRRVSQIVFRDLPVVTAQDIARGEEWARKVARALGD